MDTWCNLAEDENALQVLARVIREAGRAVHVNVLARAAVRARLQAHTAERLYAPDASYAVGETIRFRGRSATLESVQPASNAKQGSFKVLTLALPDRSLLYMAAEIAGAPAENRQPVEEDVLEQRMHIALDGEEGLTIRAAVGQALHADARFVWYQDVQGDYWCLAEMLPQVGPEELRKVAAALESGLANGEPVSKTTEDLVRAAWGAGDDGSETYALRAFALGRALLECSDIEALGDRWLWTDSWRAFTARETLAGPRIPTDVQLPAGLQRATAAQIDEEARREAASGDEEPPAQAQAKPEDMESWRRNRPTHAVFSLSARHYYEGSLPLTKQPRRLFPPLATRRQEVVFHHQFGDGPETFRAWVDREQERIWLSREMYETLRGYGIYPGTRLRISARNEREYELATRPPAKAEPIRVWRMWLEDGHIQFADDLEPRRYDVDDDVFVADVRFEDREALFRQAEEAGNSIFGLMWRKAVEWWEACGRQSLFVTADQLFEAIQFDEQSRMTSKATIAWQLWRRLAFSPVGDGKYLFRPEYGAEVRSIAVRSRPQRLPAARPEPPINRDKILRALAPPSRFPSSPVRPATGADEGQRQADGSLWQQVKAMLGRQFHTLDQAQPFQVVHVGDRSLKILVGRTDHPRTIRREEIEESWQHLSSLRELSRSEIQAHYSPLNPAYVAAILAALPGVAHHAQPIRLVYRRAQQAQTARPPSLNVERTRTGQLVAIDLVPPGPLFEHARPQGTTAFAVAHDDTAETGIGPHKDNQDAARAETAEALVAASSSSPGAAIAARYLAGGQSLRSAVANESTSRTRRTSVTFCLTRNNLHEGGRGRDPCEVYLNVDSRKAKFFGSRIIVVVTDDGQEFPARLGGHSGGSTTPKNLRSRPATRFGEWLIERHRAKPGDIVKAEPLGNRRFLFRFRQAYSLSTPAQENRKGFRQGGQASEPLVTANRRL